MFKNFRKQEGFTLVELMVVVLIIGILVAIAIPIFNNASQNAKEKTCAANIRTIRGAVQQYLATNTTATLADIDAMATLGSQIDDVANLKCPITGEAYAIADGVVTDHFNADGDHTAVATP